MLRMFRELKGSYRYIVLIFALLFGQAFCDPGVAIVHFGYYQCGCTAGWYSGQCAGSDPGKLHGSAVFIHGQ